MFYCIDVSVLKKFFFNDYLLLLLFCHCRRLLKEKKPNKQTNPPILEPLLRVLLLALKVKKI